MSYKIAYFGKKSWKKSELALSLKDRGVELHHLKDSEEFSEIHASDPFYCIVCCEDSDTQGFAECKKTLMAFPEIPAVYLLADKRELEVKMDLDVHRHFLPDSIDVAAAVALILKLSSWYQDRLEFQPEDAGERTFQFESLEFDDVLNDLQNRVSDKIPMKNLIWIEHTELQSLLEVEELGEEREESLPKTKSWQRVGRSSLKKRIKAFYAHEDQQFISGPGLDWLVTSEDDCKSYLIRCKLIKSGKVFGYLLFDRVETSGTSALEALLHSEGAELQRHLSFSVEFSRVQGKTFIDDLTQLYNSRYLKVALDNEMKRADRKEAPFTILFMDVDHFKQVNDNFGHTVGSQSLMQIGQILHKFVRGSDFAFRYGGDEFVIVLAETTKEKAQTVAERLRKKIEQTVFNIDGLQIRMTVSIGLASYPEHARNSHDVIRMADEAMYQGKRLSRNIVYLAS